MTTTPSDPKKPTRWRRQQLHIRLGTQGPSGVERRGARGREGGAAEPAGAEREAPRAAAKGRTQR